MYSSNPNIPPQPKRKTSPKRDQERKMNNFTKDKINYNPHRSFPERVKDSALLANKRLPRKNKTMKKRNTSLEALKNRPPGMGGRRKTRRKKRRKTKTKKKRRRKRRKTRRKKR